MKRIISFVVSISIIAAAFVCSTVCSADEISVEIDGKKIEFDVNPEIIDGRTMVPLRKIFEEIGANVKWDDETKTVSARKSSKTISLTIDSNELKIDKGDTDTDGNAVVENVTIEVPAQIVSGRTLVPARAISESFGLNVNWDSDKKKVIITSDDEEDDESWKNNIGTIDLTNLTFDGEGVEIADNQITISKGGDYTVSGTLEDGNITISTDEKVKIRLSGAKITSTDSPCIFVENADKAYITISDDTQNYLTSTNCEDAVIYSKDKLEIKGKGELAIVSKAGHGIKASDNLTIENGEITIDAKGDGIHINDTFNMTDGKLNITSVGDGIDSESIVNISGGEINIETNGEPIETVEETKQNQKFGFMEETPDVEFENSTKGIKASWMLCISGGTFNVNSASHAIHCEDEIDISGGVFSLNSTYDKGISAHGNLTISGSDTVIDIAKSTEGIESKNVLTINDGAISIISSDDAINATGGRSGEMMGMPNNAPNNINGENNNINREKTDGAENNNAIRGNGRRERQNENMTAPDNANMGDKQAPPNNFNMGDRQAPPDNFDMRGMTPPNDFDAENMPTPSDNAGFGNADNMQGTDSQNNRPQMPNGNFGANRSDLKDCLVINGGNIEICSGDDGIDSNGNVVINAGTIKATYSNGAFSGNFGIIDPDGKITISENANLIFASGSGSENDLTLSQNEIVIYCENKHTSGDAVIVTNKNGKTVYEYTPNGNYSSLLIASNKLNLGEAYTVKAGDEEFEVTLSEQKTVVGTKKTTERSFGRNMK